jgi:hypothetical protein
VSSASNVAMMDTAPEASDDKRDVVRPSPCANFGLVRLPRPLGLHWRKPWLKSKGVLLARLGFDARGLERTRKGWKEGGGEDPEQDGRVRGC